MELPCVVWVWVFPVPSSIVSPPRYILCTQQPPSPSLYPAPPPLPRCNPGWWNNVAHVWCLLSLPGWRMPREYWAHKTLLSTFQIIGFGFAHSHHTTHCFSINSILNGSQKVDDTCVSQTFVCGFVYIIWLLLLRLASEANNGTGAAGQRAGCYCRNYGHSGMHYSATAHQPYIAHWLILWPASLSFILLQTCVFQHNTFQIKCFFY